MERMGFPPISYDTGQAVHNRHEVIAMSYVSPSVREKFETLSVDLKNAVLERGEDINTIHDLIRILGDIVKENGG